MIVFYANTYGEDSMKKPKRFVAGAICPSCNKKDRVRIWLEGSVSYRDCVSCDFYEKSNEKPQLATNWSAQDKAISITNALS